jgi:hypothetical protein
MRRWIVALGAVLAFGVLASLGQANGYGDEKGGSAKNNVPICHVPPGNPDNAHTISVGAAAIGAHLAHGDYLGRCKKNDDGKDCKDGAKSGKDGAKSGKDGAKKGKDGAKSGKDGAKNGKDCKDDDKNGKDGGKKKKKLPICHVPPGNPGNAHTIWVGAAAIRAHLAHGDYFGRCKKDDDDKNGKNGGKKKKKLPICHVPPGNPGNAHTIWVGAAAIRAHLAHGDYFGHCKKKDDGNKGDDGDKGKDDDKSGKDDGKKRNDGDKGTDDGKNGKDDDKNAKDNDKNGKNGNDDGKNGNDDGKDGKDDGKKLTICHVPPGNPDNAHTISVGAGAVEAHLAHGDYLGPCKKKDDGENGKHDGKNGENGKHDGKNGENGKHDGKNGKDGKTGANDGKNGHDNGENGDDGHKDS